ncbi:MAG TPA: hypothetical protein VN726_01925 [Hanamia sp.]|nr:hypothetical protein [Hanamia sp.]
MKKIFTIILVAAGSISFASAQSFKGYDGHNNHRKTESKVIVQNNRFTKTNNVNYNDAKFVYQQKQEKINSINREFDQKIAFVNNRRLNNWQKTKQIQSLENQRNQALRSLDAQYAATDHRSNSNGSRYDSHKW